MSVFFTWIQGILDRFVQIVVWPVFVGASIIMLIYAGFLFVTANGDPGKIKSAREVVMWAVIGIIVGILAFSAVGIVRNFINSPIPTPPVINNPGGPGDPPTCSPNSVACTAGLNCCSGFCDLNVGTGICANAPTGACCLGQTCSVRIRPNCVGGIYYGDSTDCTGVVCSGGL